MTTRYANGYGLRVRPPQCGELPREVDCACCGGSGEHLFGEGMDADGAARRSGPAGKYHGKG